MSAPDIADLVVGYARSGVAVMPLHSAVDGRCTCGNPTCSSPAKHPRTRHGKDDATCDIGQIAEWLAQWPDSNWGGRPPAGVVVVDVDVRSGGPQTLAELEGRNSPLPSTLTARTGSDGRHIWLSYRGPSRGRIGAGLDIKVNTGYLVLPPSRHACGGDYEWINKAPAAPAPRWLRQMLNPPRRSTPLPGTGSGVGALANYVATAPQGQRNSILYWSACRAHETGLDTAALVDAAEANGLPRAEAEATVRSAERAPARAGR